GEKDEACSGRCQARPAERAARRDNVQPWSKRNPGKRIEIGFGKRQDEKSARQDAGKHRQHYFFSIGWYPALSSFFFASSASIMLANGPTWTLKNGFASPDAGASINARNPFFFIPARSFSASADVRSAPI